MSKTYTFKCAAYNLGLLLRKVWGLRKPRNGQEGAEALLLAILAWLLIGTLAAAGITKPSTWFRCGWCSALVIWALTAACRSRHPTVAGKLHFLTGC